MARQQQDRSPESTTISKANLGNVEPAMHFVAIVGFNRPARCVWKAPDAFGC